MNQIDSFLIEKAPPKCFYIPNFISKEEEEILIKKIYDVPKPKWTQLSNRRLQNWGGLPHPKGMVQEKLPQWLTLHTSKIDELKLFGENTANHVLINEYLPGQGILELPKDGSVSSSMNLEERRIGSLLLEPRSLLILYNDLYTKYLHGISERTDDVVNDTVLNADETSYSVDTVLSRQTRISLTIRHFPKVLKFKMKFI